MNMLAAIHGLGWLLPLGALAGFLAGLIGIGGGFVLVPGLQAVFALRPDLKVHGMPLILGTTTACMIATAFASARTQQRRGAVNMIALKRLGPFVAIGAALGALLATLMATGAVKAAFGVFCILSGLQFLFFSVAKPREDLSIERGFVGLQGTGFGALCGLLAVGGTNLVVPFLMRRNVDLRTAVGTASALQIPAGIAGALMYAVLGVSVLGSGIVGYVDVPVALCISAAALLFAPLGVKASHKLPVTTLKRTFGGFTALVGLRMLGWLPLPF